jgi:RNA polymerase-binding transcription factor DksA
MKEHLEKKLEKYRQELNRLDERLQVKGDYGHGKADPRVVNWEFDLLRREQVNTEIEKIEKALEKLSSGSYGICRQCYKEIDPERLKILPYTTLCIECARKSKGG